MTDITTTTYYGAPSGVVYIRASGVDAAELPLNGLAAEKSPTGFGWGYAGSGAAALAWALLVNALGPAATCPDCDGTRQVTWDNETGALRPLNLGADPAGSSIGCGCGHGIRQDLPYQPFKFSVVAALPNGEAWQLTRGEVLAWCRGYAAHHAELGWLGEATGPGGVAALNTTPAVLTPGVADDRYYVEDSTDGRGAALHCVTCRRHICWIDHQDDLATLNRLAVQHVCVPVPAR